MTIDLVSINWHFDIYKKDNQILTHLLTNWTLFSLFIMELNKNEYLWINWKKSINSNNQINRWIERFSIANCGAEGHNIVYVIDFVKSTMNIK